MSAKSSEQLLEDSCNNLKKLMEKPRIEEQEFGEYVAKDISKLDPDLLNMAKHKISNILYEINEIQIKRQQKKTINELF